jgi:GNAT superfamily N-acetyltransferase
VIRRARAADAEALAVLQVRAWHHAYGDLVDPDLMPGVPQRTQMWREHLGGQQPRATFVFESEGRLAGFVSAGADRDGELGTGEVYAVYVEPAAQGAGVGGALLEHAVSVLRESGHTAAVLWTLAANGLARTFYERRGWAADGARRDHPWGAEIRYRRAL